MHIVKTNSCLLIQFVKKIFAICIIKSPVIYYFIKVLLFSFQVWDNILSLEAKEKVSCRQTSDENVHHLSVKQTNVGLTFDGNITKVIGHWLREGQNFIPEFEMCLDFQACKNFLTVSE